MIMTFSVHNGQFCQTYKSEYNLPNCQHFHKGSVVKNEVCRSSVECSEVIRLGLPCVSCVSCVEYRVCRVCAVSCVRLPASLDTMWRCQAPPCRRNSCTSGWDPKTHTHTHKVRHTHAEWRDFVFACSLQPCWRCSGRAAAFSAVSTGHINS